MNGLLGGLTILATITSIVYVIVAILVPIFIFSMNSKLGKLLKEQQRTNQILNYLVEQGNRKSQQN
jgi:glycopeptide antibiotics resistance protein